MSTRRTLERYSALAVLEELLEAGLEVEADRPHLRIRPAADVAKKLLTEARRLKPYLLDLLDPPAPDGPCPDCGDPYYARQPLGQWTCMVCGDLSAEEIADVARCPQGRPVREGS